jgi:endonuclease-3 related protein
LSREELLKVYGVGEETADVIMLYAYNFPTFVVDEYTLRWFGRFFGFLPKKGEIREILHFEDLFYLKEMHALIDELGKRFCKKEPLCENCPLRVKCSFARK